MNRIAITTLAAISALSFAGCSSATEPTVTPASSSPSASASRQAGMLATRVCVNNSTGRSITLDITQADTGTGERVIPNGARDCAEGTFLFKNWDVVGEINKGATDRIRFAATNKAVDFPRFAILENFCPVKNEFFRVGNTANLALPTLKMQIERIADSQAKNFEIFLTDGDGTTEGKTGPVQCRGPQT